MVLNKQDMDKNGGLKPTKIPPVTARSLSQPRSVISRNSRNIQSAISKIPKRDAGNFSLHKQPLTTQRLLSRPLSRPPSRPADTKKASRSTVSLSIKKYTPRQQFVCSSSSNINTQRSTKSTEPTARSQDQEPRTEKAKKASERVAAMKNILAFQSLKEKVRTYQTEFMKKWEVLKAELPPEDGEYKLIGLVKNSDGQLLTKTAQKFKGKCHRTSLDQFKKEIHNYVKNNLNLVLDSLNEFKNTPTVGDHPQSLTAIEEVEHKMRNDHINALEDILKQIESFEPTDQVPENTDLENKIVILLKETEELRKNYEQNEIELIKTKNIEEENKILFKKELEEKDKKLAKKQFEFDEIKYKLENLERENKTYRDLQDKLTSKTAEIDELKKKLRTLAQSNVTQTNRNQEHEARIKKLDTDLKAALKDLENRAEMEQSIGDQAIRDADEIKTLRRDLLAAKREITILEKEVHNLKIDKINDNTLETEIKALKAKGNQKDEENNALQQTIKGLENQIHVFETQVNLDKNANEELNKLRKSDSEKSEKLNAVEMELTKAHFQNQKLEEKIAMDRKMLKIRCGLIETLQTKENTQKIHLEELFAEVGEKNNDIQMLKAEISSKNEEFQNLFSTLSGKQMEITRQEHMIKLLQESNERAQTIRVRQEAKIGRLEEEVTQLKQAISLYQDAVLPSDALRKNLLMAEANRQNQNSDNLGYYVDERRRKRQVDINVKKYEK